MSRGHQHFRMLAFEDWSWFEETIDRFVNDWRRGRRPGFEDYLPTDARLRYPLLVELTHTELELRVKAGEAVRVEEYLTRYPELAADAECALELIAAEYRLRRSREPDLPPDDYLRRFPEHRARPRPRRGRLRGAGAAGARRHGRGVQGAAAEPQPPRRPQVPARGVRR